MSKLDEKKEYIGILKVYLGFILAIIISVGTGTSKLYLAKNVGVLFLTGCFILVVAIFIFMLIAKLIHKHIKTLKDL